MLVIIAIVMAMAAPLIAHKANTDQKRLIFNGVGAHIATAMGNSQNFGIGTKNPSNAKLTVNATNNSQNLIAKFVSNFVVNNGTNEQKAEKAKKIIFQVLPKSGDNYIKDNGNPEGFKVFADGTTNAGCMPDYDKRTIISTTTNPDTDTTGVCSDTDKNGYCMSYDIPKDGYIISGRNVALYYNKDDIVSNKKHTYQPPMIPKKITATCTNNADVATCTFKVAQYAYAGRIIIPVRKNNSIRAYLYNTANNTTDPDNTLTFEINKSDRTVVFVPCVQ